MLNRDLRKAIQIAVSGFVGLALGLAIMGGAMLYAINQVGCIK